MEPLAETAEGSMRMPELLRCSNGAGQVVETVVCRQFKMGVQTLWQEGHVGQNP